MLGPENIQLVFPGCDNVFRQLIGYIYKTKNAINSATKYKPLAEIRKDGIALITTIDKSR